VVRVSAQAFPLRDQMRPRGRICQLHPFFNRARAFSEHVADVRPPVAVSDRLLECMADLAEFVESLRHLLFAAGRLLFALFGGSELLVVLPLERMHVKAVFGWRK